MKKVLIVNRGCCDNLGDQAINIAMKKFITSNYNVSTSFSDYTSLSKEPKNIDLNVSNITLKMNLRELLKKFLPLKLIWLIRNYSRLNRIIKDNVDYIVIGGGQLILSNSTFDIAAATWVYLAKSYNIPIIFCSVGAGTNFNFINKTLFSYALRNANSICVRDETSRATIRNEFNIDSYVSG
ncbi:polysaccharide pyruvyl transferase family protein, partial [Streptomyces filamentosus]|uniref:polysaccharide pyruvyl transferase family protein n=2 Tax=Bacteria TaxID=2 RepID=UPI0033FD1CE4